MSIYSYVHYGVRITVGSVWTHNNSKKIYTVLLFTNLDSAKPDKFPKTIIYTDTENRIWSRTLDSWLQSMTLIP